jgi:ETC complex I subunit conserved region
MLARIYRPSKTAMQSGRAKTHEWLLAFEPASARIPDPLMGWTSSADMNAEVTLTFETKDQAVAYAQNHGIAFRVFEPHEPRRVIKAYADNFAFNRKASWTH